MFRDTRRKKLRNRIILTSLGIFVLSFGIWLNYQSGVEEEAARDVVKKVEVNDKEKESSNVKEESRENNSQGTDTEMEPRTYLIKEIDGVVKVFICDEDNNKELYLITSIPFDLLSESDQQLFIDGVKMKTEEDLGKFLENFDS